MEEKVGQYRLGSLIGEGMFTQVYRAVDEAQQRDVALKVLKPAWASDPQAVERFMQEVKGAARLTHPHIAAIYEAGEVGGQVYVAQLLVEGESLATRLQRGPLSWPEMLDILHPVASALDYAHRRGVLHRDVKPANILLDQRDHVYLTDFGLVRVAEGSADLSATSSGQAGTPPYMAPEVWEGKNLSSATDVYALSCVVVEMLSGQVLFDGADPAQIRQQHLSGRPDFQAEWMMALPVGAIEVFKWGLAPEASHRINSAGELAAVLAGLTDSPQPDPIRTSSLQLPHLSSPPPPDKPKVVLEPQPKRSGLWVAGITALVIIVLGLMVIGCISLYLFTANPSGAAQSSPNLVATEPVAEASLASINLTTPSPTPTSQATSPPPPSTSPPPTSTPQPPTATVPPSPQPSVTLEATPTPSLEATPTIEAERTVTTASDVLPAVEPEGTATATVTPPPVTATPTGPVIPEGKGLLIYENKTDYELIIDVVNPAENKMVTTVTLPPGAQQEFFLDPGQYVFNAHTAGGGVTVQPEWVEVVEGEWAEFACC